MAAESTSGAAAAPQRKPRTLADLMDEQVKQGRLPAEEVNKPVEWRQQRSSGGGARRGDAYGNSGGGRRWNEPSLAGNADASVDDPNLNWQQKELLAKSGGRSWGGNNGASNGYSNTRGGDSSGSSTKFGFNNNRRGGQGRGGFSGGVKNGRGDGQSSAKASTSDLPEWAADLDNSPADDNSSSLNWQQKSLLSRDMSDPFNRLVRGEDEYHRE